MALQVAFAAQVNKAKAEEFFQEGLMRMENSTHPVESDELFTQAITLYPRLWDAYFWKVKAQLIFSHWEGAVATVNRALRLQPPQVKMLMLHACLLYSSRTGEGDDEVCFVLASKGRHWKGLQAKEKDVKEAISSRAGGSQCANNTL